MASRSGTEGPDLKVGLTSLLDSETRPATYDLQVLEQGNGVRWERHDGIPSGGCKGLELEAALNPRNEGGRDGSYCSTRSTLQPRL